MTVVCRTCIEDTVSLDTYYVCRSCEKKLRDRIEKLENVAYYARTLFDDRFPANVNRDGLLEALNALGSIGGGDE